MATALPFVLTAGDLSHSAGNGDWVKVKLPAGKTSLRVQTSGDLNTDAVVAVTTDGSTAAGHQSPPMCRHGRSRFLRDRGIECRGRTYFASFYRWQLYFFAAILSHRRESTIFHAMRPVRN